MNSMTVRERRKGNNGQAKLGFATTPNQAGAGAPSDAGKNLVDEVP